MKMRVLIGIVAIMLPAISVAALTTSTTTVDVATTTSLVSLDASSTAPADTSATTSSPTSDTSTATGLSTSATSTDASAATTPSINPADTATAKSIASLENSYFEKNGTYFQVLSNNAVPSHETGTVIDQLGAEIPANAQVDIYEAPAGRGYQITYIENGTLYSAGYGPEAQDRTYAFASQANLPATSTPAVAASTESTAPVSTSTTQ